MDPVEIDRLPVMLTQAQAALWRQGPAGKRQVRKQIRAERQEKQYTDDEIASMEKAPSFDEVMGDA